MKNKPILRILALLFSLLLALTFAACKQATEPASEGPAAENPTVAPAQPTEEPETDEVTLSDPTDVVSAETEAPASEDVPAPEDTQAPEATPAQEATPAPEATPASEATPAPGQQNTEIIPNPLPDGEYKVNLYRDLAIDREGRTWATVGELRFVELDDSVVSALKNGDKVDLKLYSFVVEMTETTAGPNGREILFNDGTERCIFIEETNTWRFLWPGGEPYTYEDGTYVTALAADVVLVDELTPLSEGQNVYGAAYDERDKTIGALDCLEDFFGHYYGLESEQAAIVVENGKIVSVVIEFHP